jgi:hypothetical protein
MLFLAPLLKMADMVFVLLLELFARQLEERGNQVGADRMII